MRRMWWLVVLLVLASACSGGRDEAAAPASVGAPASDGAEAESAEGAADPAPEGDLVGVGAQVTDREIIYTATLTVRVDDVAAAADAVEAMARGAGGLVFASELSGEQRQRATITLKVPPAGFEQALSAVRDLGRVVDERVSAEDVTAEVVDLESRIESARTSIDRLRGFLAEAADVGEIVTVESELSRRESELEAMLGRLRVLQDQVALATITVHLAQPDDPQVAENLPGFAGGLRAGLVAFVNVAQVIATVVGFLLPFLLVVGLLVIGVVALVRLRRRRDAAPPSAPPPAG